MKAMVLRGPNTPFEMVHGARSDARSGRGGGARLHLRRGAHHPARQGRPPQNRISAHHRPRDHRRDRRAGRGRVGAQGGRRRHGLFLSQLRPLPLLPHATRAALRATAAAMSGWNATAAMPNTSSCRRTSSSNIRKGSTTRARPAEMGVITDALATPYKVLRRAQVKAGETVAVIGAGGGARHPSGDDGEMGQCAGDRGRHGGRQIRRLPQGRRRRGGRSARRRRGRRRCAISRTARASTSSSITSPPRRRRRPPSGRSASAAAWSFSAARRNRSTCRRATC